MADIANLKIGSTSYTIKDSTARTNAGNADTKADQAILDAAAAQGTANTADAKISGASITGTYTAGTETLEISLTLGTTGS